jgi:hypothetical protein
VNFFGHAVVASWLRSEVGYVFGSMLPDFAAMIGARLPPIRHPHVSAGVRAHHAVDEVFHELSTFRNLCRMLGAELIRLGFDRGRARAVAHVGAEILLDGPLADDPRACKLYWAALDQATPDGLGQYVAWDEQQRVRFERLRAALEARRDAEGVDARRTTVHRLERALQGRPHLALNPDHCDKVALWLVKAESAVSAGAAALVEELKAGLIARVLDFTRDDHGAGPRLPSPQPDRMRQQPPTG